ncbi:MAG: hypothetical protein ACKV2Q_32770 [Planctomycetaceae bacterium]
MTTKFLAATSWLTKLLLVLFLTLSGCTTTGLLSKWTHREATPKATATNPAVRILCMWQPADGTGVDDKPARGVAGQIFFFTQNSVTPVEVEGDVRIFLFDDQGPEAQQGAALHEFDFVKGAWKAHLVGTQFGPAYQLFVPYSRKGHHQAELAIRIRLTPPNGPVIFSDMAKINLPGFDNKQAYEEDSEVTSGAAIPSGEHRMVGKTTATDGGGSFTEVTPERIRQAYLEVLADRTKSTAPTPAPAPANRHARQQPSEQSPPQAAPPTRTPSSVVGRVQVNSRGQNLIAAQEEFDSEEDQDDTPDNRRARRR